MLEHYNVQSQYESLDPGDTRILQYGVYSGNSKHKTEYFKISWSGEWRDNSDDMFKELVIEHTKNPENKTL